MKKLLVLSWAGTNIGDNAILFAIIELVRKKFGYINIYALVADEKFVKDNYHVTDAVSISEFHKPEKLPKILRFLREADAFIYVGGDTIGGNFRSMLLAGMAVFLGIPIVFCGCGVLPTKYKLMKSFVKIILENARLITVRDEYSERLIREYYCVTKPPVYVTADLAFLLQPPTRNSNIVSNDVKIGINVASYDPMYYFYSSREHHNNALKIITNVCNFLAEKYNVTLIFFPTDKVDYEILKKVANIVGSKKVIVVEQLLKPKDLMTLLSQLNLVVAFRLHALIFAMSVGVPVIAVSYAPKIEALFSSMGQSKYVIPINDLNEGKLLNIINERLRMRGEDIFVNIMRRKAKLNEYLIGKTLQQKRRKAWAFYLFLPSIIPVVMLISTFYSAFRYLRH
jgi:polysaccharide pyruvyl transferase WcaK-like protein